MAIYSSNLFDFLIALIKYYVYNIYEQKKIAVNFLTAPKKQNIKHKI